MHTVTASAGRRRRTTSAARGRSRRIVATLLAGLLALIGSVGLAGAAQADAALTVTYTHEGQTYGGVPVIESGRDYEVRVGYGRVADGRTAVLQVPAGVTIPDSALVLPPGNTAVTALARQADGSIAITFADPFPAGIDQGILTLAFRVDEVTTSVERDLTWSVDGTSTVTPVIVKKPGDELENVQPSTSKAAGRVDLGSHVRVVDGRVVLEEALLERTIPYTVTAAVTTAGPLTITDTLGAGLTLVPGSFAATLTTWDAAGLNATTAPASAPSATGTSVSHTLDLPAPSRYTLTYSARIADAAALEDLRERLQASYDALDGEGGSYWAELTNTAVIGSDTRTTATRIGGTAAAPSAPDAGAAFGKSTPTPRIEVTTADGDLAGPVDVSYELRADLTAWDSSTPRHTLTRDVVVSDTLPRQAAWSSEGDALVVTTAEGAEIALTEVEGGAAEVLAAGAFSYSLQGRELHVNLGRDAVAYTLTARAVISTLDGLQTYPQGAVTTYLMGNTASFDHGAASAVRKSVDVRLVAPSDTSGGIDHPDSFRKSGPTTTLVAAPGERLAVPYTFVIGENVADVRSSVITDVVDHDVFDVSDLAAIKDSIRATAAWWVNLTGEHVDVALDEEGNLTLELNEAGEAAVSMLGDRPRLDLTLTLTTHPVVGKQSVEISNSATLSGGGLDFEYRSSATTSGTTFGDELEVRKTVYDAERDEYTSNLRVGLTPDGSLVTNEFVYRVEVLPHGSYHGVAIRTIADVLPDGVEFVGFSSAEGVSSGTIVPGDSQNLGGNLVATWDEATRTVALDNADGTVLPPIDSVELYFAVRIADFTPQVGITNVIGGTDATITPTNDFPLDVSKVDSTDAGVVITDRDARFTVTDSQGVTVVSDAYVVDGKLRVAGPGGDEGLRVPSPGTYTITETTAPRGYLLATESVRVTVAEDGTSPTVRLFNTPGETPVDPEPEVPGRVSVGDYVWFDVNRDGLQDDTDVPLEGVTLTVLGPDGEPVALDADGEPYASTTVTDAAGRYEFADLPVLEPGQTYTVVVTAPEGYEPTVSLGGGVGAEDSSTGRAVSQLDLTLDGAHDPTLDFGFVRVEAPTDPEPTDPEPTEPEPTDPEPTEPEPSASDPEPSATEPSATDPSASATDAAPSASAPAPRNGLASTGAAPFAAGLIGLALVAGGLLLVRRRSRADLG